MKTIQRTLTIAALTAATLIPSLAKEAAPNPVKVSNDGADTKHGRVANMHQTRYIEIFLAYQDEKSGKLVGATYNSMFSAEGIPASKDTAPQNKVEGLDFEAMKKDLGLAGASLNGPKLWMPDWSEMEVGTLRDFNGISAPWIALLDMSEIAGGVTKSAPYEPKKIARKSKVGWNKGTKVVLLDDADGNTWIMKGFQLGLEPKFTYEEFIADAPSMFKKLPAGWKVRVKVLEEDLIENPENGIATIMPDEHFNVYDKTGPGMSNIKP